jgi:peptidoglycan/LPS O-acetylase OafA/YrhL
LNRSGEVQTVGVARLGGFDGLRGLAAVAVLVLHVSVLRLGGHPGMQDFVAQLQSGVQVFFVISGFVISRPFVVALLDGTPRPNLSRYARRRFVRIFPAYWVALVCAAVFFGAPLSGPRDWLLHLLLLQTYSSYQFNRGIGIAWTLSVEVSFYVLLPFVFVAVEWLSGRLGARRALVVSLVALLIASCAAVQWTVASGRTLPTFWLPFQLPVFVVGMLMCVAAEVALRGGRGRSSVDRLGALLPLWWIAALGCLLLAAHLFGATVVFRARHQLGQEVLYGLVAAFAVLPVAFGFERSGLGGRLLEWRPVAYVGAISYGLYLWHNQLGEFIADHGFGRGSLERTPLLILLALIGVTLAATVAIASVSWFRIERPLQRRWRR